jgi:hypothetical protein
MKKVIGAFRDFVKAPEKAPTINYIWQACKQATKIRRCIDWTKTSESEIYRLIGTRTDKKMSESKHNLQRIIWHQYVKVIRAQRKWEQNKYKEEHSANWRRHRRTLTESSNTRVIITWCTSNLH